MIEERKRNQKVENKAIYNIFNSNLYYINKERLSIFKSKINMFWNAFFIQIILEYNLIV